MLETLKSKNQISRIILLEILIVFGAWRLWKFNINNIHVPYIDFLNDLPREVFLSLYALLFIFGVSYVIYQKYFLHVIYVSLLLLTILQDRFTYHHSEFTFIFFSFYIFLPRFFKEKFKENIFIACLYLLCVLPKLNYDYLSGTVTDNLLANILGFPFEIGYVGGVGSVILELLACFLFLEKENK
ncbi:hypothetical protein N9P84_04360, partial [Polaribacter sp.]|nr:hypothetical protein [Polaribacter sp.]